MSVRRALFVALAFVLTSCGGASEESAPEPQPSSTRDGIAFEYGRALIDTESGSVLVRVEIAENEEQQTRGLSGRASLPDDSGMFYVYFNRQDAGLRASGPTFATSAAFIDDEGRIVRILDLDRCNDPPCDPVSPGTSYSAALQVDRGAFDRWGVSVGDRVTLTH